MLIYLIYTLFSFKCTSHQSKYNIMATNRDLYILPICLIFYIAKVEAGRGGFLYICIGSGCTPGQIALMVITIILVIFCCGAGAYCKCKQKNRPKVFSYAKKCNESVMSHYEAQIIFAFKFVIKLGYISSCR